MLFDRFTCDLNGQSFRAVLHYMGAALGERGIRVNARSARRDRHRPVELTKTEPGRAAALAMQTIKRIGRPEDVADVVAFLVSDVARFMTGAIVDGGAAL